MAKAKHAVPEGHYTVTPQLTLGNASEAIEWYKKALGAEELGRAVGPDGKIMHAEIRIGDSRIMLNDEMGGGRSPRTIGGSPASLWIYVEDCDALFNRAVAAGAGDVVGVERIASVDIAANVARAAVVTSALFDAVFIRGKCSPSGRH